MTHYHWVKAYQERGEAGLRNQGVSAGSRRNLPGPVREKIVEIKRREPFFGVQRISHLLKRVFFLSASPETVRVLRDVDQNHQMFSSRSSFRIAVEMADAPIPKYRSLPPSNPTS